MLQIFCLLKPNILEKDNLLQQIVVLLTSVKKESKQFTNKYGRMNTFFDLLQKLNISSSNESSLSLDTFLLLKILFCKVAFSTRF